jgi:hypothetical protein
MSFSYRIIEDYTNCITAYRGQDNEVVIPDNLNATVLYDDLFKGHTEITSVKIPDSITQIGGFVFDGCVNLRSINLPPNLIDMWQYALTRCGIESITIPGSVRTVIPFTFYQCKALKSVTLNEGTQKICARAFKDCTALSVVYLPKSLTDIHDLAFEGCSNLTFHRMG